MANIYDLTDTWNDAGVAFNAIKMDVTDTASDAGSNLLDLQVGGVSKFSVDKSGNANGDIIWAERLYTGTSFNSWRFSATTSGIQVRNTSHIGFADSATLTVFSPTVDVRLHRDATGILAQRNDTNAQTFNIYNTYTDASNYERIKVGWSSNVCQIQPEAAGTGTVRALHISGLPTTDPAISGVLWNDAGTVKVSA